MSQSYQQRSFDRPRFNNGSRFASRSGFSRAAHRPKTFDPSFCVKKATQAFVAEPIYTPQYTFASFDLHQTLQANITHRGYTAMTPIQDQAIPQLLAGRDVIGIANTGTGKTAAFLIPLINKVMLDRSQKVLIVAPTRELATQIEQELRQFTFGMHLYSTLCIGGVNIRPQIFHLQRNPQFVIGTPGRLRDLEKQAVLRFSVFNNIVLDEVDQMFNMGFIRDVKYITAALPKVRQSLFFSATLPDSLQAIVREFLHNPIRITIKSQDTSANIDQDVIRVNGRQKIDILQELLLQKEFAKVLVFSRTKHATEKLARSLGERGFAVNAIHGNRNQNQRQRAIEQFKRDHIQVLIATDVASRGLDIDNVSHVINFDLPETYEDYIHRIGRTGRANKKGIALTFVD